VSPTALDLDEDGEIVEAELEDVLKSSFDQRSMGNSSIEDIKGQILAFTGPNLTAYYMEKTGGASGNDSSPDASLLQEGRLFGAIFTVATKTVSFASHMAQGKSAGSWVVNEFKDPWNYVGFVPGMKQAGKAWKGYTNVRAGAIRAGQAKDVYDTYNKGRYLASRYGGSSSHGHTTRSNYGRSPSFQPRPSNRNCASQAGWRCGAGAGRFAVCPAGSWCSGWGWCGTSSAHRNGAQALYSNNYHNKCSAGGSSASGSSASSARGKCESQTGHRCGASTRGVCSQGRWCTSAGWCHNYFSHGKSEWSNNAGRVCPSR